MEKDIFNKQFHFIEKVKLPERVHVPDAVLWCKEQFGAIPTIYIEPNGSIIADPPARVYDKEKATWMHEDILSYHYRNFYFKNTEDAMAFKLRWL